MQKYRPIYKSTVFYRSMDGVYHSYWIGKLCNCFIKKGKKKWVYNQLYRSFILIKLTQNILPTIYLLEVMEKLKPFFILKKWFQGNNERWIIYPKLSKSQAAYSLVLHRIKALVIMSYKEAYRGDIDPFFKLIYQGLLAISAARGNSLIKQRDQDNIVVAHKQDNIRYTWV